MLDFWINGVSALSKGIYTEEITPPVKPSRRLNLQAVPGRSGFLTIGDKSYNPYVRYATCFVEDNTRLAEVWQFLDGARTVRFSTDTGHQLECISIDQIDPEEFTLESCSFTVGFTCQPYRYIYPEAPAVQVRASGSTINNSGTEDALPRITVLGTGDKTLTLGGELIELSGGGVIIDSALEEVFDLDGITLAGERVIFDSGHWPHLAPGANTVSYTGACTGVDILMRERDK